MRRLSTHRWLAALLAASLGLRLWLACRGGQYFWPDEMRYGQTREAAYDLTHGLWKRAAAELFGHPDHPLFRLISLPAALAEQCLGPHPALAASYLGLYSVAAVGLIWAIARRAGGDEAEAVWAAGLAAGSGALFYYSRHLLPYDAALAWVLASLWLALGAYSPRNSLLAGVCAGLGFLTYNGYWLPAAVVLGLHAFFGAGGGRKAPGRAGWSAAGLALTLAAMTAASSLATGRNWIAASREFSATVTQGDFGQGYRVIGEYLWAAEGGSLILWALGIGMAVAGWSRAKRRLAWYLGGAALVLGGLWMFSDVFHRFVVYGRLVRSAVPFLCLGAAVGLRRLAVRPAAAAGLAAAALALAAVALAGPLRQWFPLRFEAAAADIIAGRTGDRFRIYREDFAYFLWARPVDSPPPAGTVVLRRTHPLQFRPYQYEGDDQRRRDELNRHDFAMRLTELPLGFDRDPRRWSGYPGPVRFRLVFPTDQGGRSEPIVTAGRPQRADFLYVTYRDDRHVSFGLDQWGGGAVDSAPIELDYRIPHELVVWLGSLLPPAGDPSFRAAGIPDTWRDQVLVALDGNVVFFRPQSFAAVRPEEITFASDVIGGTLVQPSFTGTVEGFGPAPAGEVRSALAEFFPSADGRLRLHLRLPAGRTGRREPLVVTGTSGHADLLEIHYLDSGHVKFALDHWGRSFQESPSIALDYERPHTLECQLPALAWPEPADGSPGSGDMTLRLDGAVVWRAPVEFYHAARSTLAIAANRIGGSTCDPAFSGIVLGLGP